eukprot:CAMPEP_0172673044 /NCGR_PEP_ID=MMETSP1074-20121228/11912_1 /TAXON_ID=2916 /ORGANISM="Ceratium fusus, Strain PA161109" /LENGTH=155 /DNA_ID=CAMNT_0013490305 /DNA_START=91 /DNA_END=555 /DNA_ORIENTATION=+
MWKGAGKMQGIPPSWMDKIYRLWYVISVVGGSNLCLIYRLLSSWRRDDMAAPAPDKLLGVMVFGVGTIATLLLSLGVLSCGLPGPRKGSNHKVFLVKLFSITALFGGVQLWIMLKMLYWQGSAVRPLQPGEIKNATNVSFAQLLPTSNGSGSSTA